MKKLGFGLMRLPLNGYSQRNIDYNTLRIMADEFISKGFSHFDTAYVYHSGMSEIAFREIVAKRYPRDKFSITDKMPVFMVKDRTQLYRIFNEQLLRCGVSYFDYYWLHSVAKDSIDKCEELKAFDFLIEMKEKGKIKNIGFSFHDKADLLDIILKAHPQIDCVQLQINYIDWDDDTIESEKCYNIALKYGKKIMVMEPLKGGALTNVPKAALDAMKAQEPTLSPASWGIRFAASLDNVVCVLSGMSTLSQMRDNISYMNDFKPFSREDYAVVNKAADIIKSSITIPCTSCHYCTDGCPKKIAIPEYFSIYNNYKRNGGKNITTSAYFSNLIKTHGKPSDCIGCGQCEKRCPQHLPIIKYLKKVAQELE